MRTSLWPVFLAITAGFVPLAMAHDVIELGRTNTGQLGLHIEPHYDLTASTITGVTGFARPGPAFESMQLPDPTDPGEGLLPIDAASLIRARVVALDNLIILDPDTLFPFEVGSTIFLGKRFFRFEPIWQIPTGEIGAEGVATLIFEDQSGIHSDSQALAVTFHAVPMPGAAGVLALGGLVACRRRR